MPILIFDSGLPGSTAFISPMTAENLLDMTSCDESFLFKVLSTPPLGLSMVAVEEEEGFVADVIIEAEAAAKEIEEFEEAFAGMLMDDRGDKRVLPAKNNSPLIFSWEA